MNPHNCKYMKRHIGLTIWYISVRTNNTMFSDMIDNAWSPILCGCGSMPYSYIATPGWCFFGLSLTMKIPSKSYDQYSAADKNGICIPNLPNSFALKVKRLRYNNGSWSSLGVSVRRVWRIITDKRATYLTVHARGRLCNWNWKPSHRHDLKSISTTLFLVLHRFSLDLSYQLIKFGYGSLLPWACGRFIKKYGAITYHPERQLLIFSLLSLALVSIKAQERYRTSLAPHYYRFVTYNLYNNM